MNQLQILTPDGKIVLVGYEQGSPFYAFYNGLVIRLSSIAAERKAKKKPPKVVLPKQRAKHYPAPLMRQWSYPS